MISETAAPAAAAVPQESPPGTKFQMARSFATMFLPVIGYMVGSYLVEHWETARQVEVALAPYAFSTSLVLGLVVGLAQMAWTYSKTRKLSSYVFQQLAWLLSYTFIPLYFGHFVGITPQDPVGYNVLGLVGMGLAAVYAGDCLTGARLMMAFPLHFSPEVASKVHLPGFRRTMLHIELALVAMFAIKGAFLVFGTRMLDHATYLLVMPFVLKGLLFSFLTFVAVYSQWAKRQGEKRRAAAALATT